MIPLRRIKLTDGNGLRVYAPQNARKKILTKTLADLSSQKMSPFHTQTNQTKNNNKAMYVSWQLTETQHGVEPAYILSLTSFLILSAF